MIYGFHFTCHIAECNMSFIRRLFGGNSREYDSKYPYPTTMHTKSVLYDHNFPTFNRPSHETKYYKNTSTNTDSFFVDIGINCDIPSPLVYHKKRHKKSKTSNPQKEAPIETTQKVIEINPISNVKPEILKSFQDDFLFGIENKVPSQSQKRPIFQFTPNSNNSKKVNSDVDEDYIDNSSCPGFAKLMSKLKIDLDSDLDSDSKIENEVDTSDLPKLEGKFVFFNS